MGSHTLQRHSMKCDSKGLRPVTVEFTLPQMCIYWCWVPHNTVMDVTLMKAIKSLSELNDIFSKKQKRGGRWRLSFCIAIMYVPLNILYGPWGARQECRLYELSADEYPVQIVQSHGINIAGITMNIIANVFLKRWWWA
jgi:hypothetical protein